MALRKAWLRASVLLISREKISLPAKAVNGVSWPSDWAIPAQTQPNTFSDVIINTLKQQYQLDY